MKLFFKTFYLLFVTFIAHPASGYFMLEVFLKGSILMSLISPGNEADIIPDHTSLQWQLLS
ncbi:hypothetical protein GCM10027442_23610 [Emticicia fontis]